MRISYNDDVDVLYIQLRDGVQGAEAPMGFPPAPIEVTPWMRVDIGYDGEPAGIEIDGASKRALLDSVLVTDLPLAGGESKASLRRMGLISMADFAKLAGVSQSTLRDHRSSTAKSPLPAPVMHVGKSPLWRLSDAKSWVKSRDARPGKAAAPRATGPAGSRQSA